MCLTATYSGIDQTCTLYSARLNQGNFQLKTTNLMTSVLTIKNKTLPDPLKFTIGNETVYGVWNTIVGGNSSFSSVGISIGNYAAGQSPEEVFDGSTNTAYFAYGACSFPMYNYGIGCGEDTGLYFSLLRGPSLLVGFKFYGAQYIVTALDPMTITIEGSNEVPSVLTLGSSWTLIYNGSSGLDTINYLDKSGTTQWLSNNSVWYSSYRILITSKRSGGFGTCYSELELFGYENI